jgi:hypothetical protein
MRANGKPIPTRPCGCFATLPFGSDNTVYAVQADVLTKIAPSEQLLIHRES